jgi:hypothetical protein
MVVMVHGSRMDGMKERNEWIGGQASAALYTGNGDGDCGTRRITASPPPAYGKRPNSANSST